MKRHQARWLPKTLVLGFAVLLGGSPVAAQTKTGTGGGSPSSGLGSTANTGGGPSGGTPLSLSGTGRTGTGSSTTAPSPTTQNPYSTFYSSPLAPGLGTYRTISSGNFASSSSTGGSTTGSTGGGGGGKGATTGTGFSTTFNSGSGLIETVKSNSLSQPLFAVTTTTTTTSLGSTNPASGFSTYGTPRAPAYVTAIGFDAPRTLVDQSALQTELQQLLQRSDSLKGRAVEVLVQGSTVTLRGTLPSERQRRVAEGMVRLTPGVREVRNEIQVPPEALPPQ